MSIQKYIFILLMIVTAGCGEKNNSNNPAASDNDTIPALRKDVNKKPVAAYLTRMGDARLDRKFGVEIFETPQTFKYLLVMYYDGTVQNDTLNIPDFGIWPVIKVNPGKEKLSCIIGFLDRNKEFREYKMLSEKDGQLALTTLKRYAVTTYSK